MSERFQLPLPMWHVQYQLLGGNRRMLTVVGGAVAVLVIGIFGTQRFFHPQPFAVIAPVVLGFLTGILAFITVLAGCNAVYRAMLRDHQSNMIESHRLTPVSNLAVTLGYLFGSTLQTMVLFVVIMLAGVVVSYVSGFPVDGWIRGCLLLLSGAVTLWAASVFIGMRPEKPMSPAPILIGCAALSALIALIPALGLMSNVYAVFLGVWMMNGTVPVPRSAVAIVAVVNVAFTLFWVSASAVKYRRPDLPALNGGRGLALLVLTLFVGTAGIVAFEYITGTNVRMADFFKRDLPRSQWIVTMIGALLLAAVAIAGAVKCRVLSTRGTALRDWPDRVPPLLVAVLAAVLICAIMAGIGSSIWPGLLPGPLSDTVRGNLSVYARVWFLNGAACLLAALSIRSVLEIGYRLFASPKFVVTVYFLIAWALPPIGDSIRMEYLREFHGAADYSWLTGCSPAGTIIAVWSPLEIRLWPGLLVQLGLAVVLALAAWRSATSDKRRIANG